MVNTPDNAAFSMVLESMNAEMARAPAIIQPSKFWQDLNQKHGERLANSGLENFRRTLAKDYFTWMRVLPWDSQIRFLVKNLPAREVGKAIIGAFKKHEYLGVAESLAMNFLSRLLWSYTKQEHPEITDLSECPFGNPPLVSDGKHLVSQDLANSLLEFSSYRDAVHGTVCELGGGYGRNAYVTAMRGTFERYILVDIAPALGVAQAFIEHAFPTDPMFRFRPFSSYDEIRDDLKAARFAFLLPHQMALLPSGSVDLFINISSLHEMRRDQVDYYLSEIRRLTRVDGHFYLKAWATSNNPDDEVRINADDYDLSGFEQVYWRTPKVQTRFFETLQKR
ncbi:MAG: putative sugar O-methyltransferase, partial [Deltaproteobacteria bacterium]